jgi:hypothetical protein
MVQLHRGVLRSAKVSFLLNLTSQPKQRKGIFTLDETGNVIETRGHEGDFKEW